MQTLSRTSCIFTLLSVSVYWNSCACWISLCTDDTTSSQNGTSVPAKLKAPVSVFFCVQSDYQIHSSILIHHNNHGTEWYPETPTANDKMYVNIETLVPDQLKAIINITILHVENQDFNDVFKVTVYTLRQPVWSEKVEFWFGLKQEGWISLCTDDTTSSQNGTSVPAKLGAPVSVSFCVHSDYPIYSRILIQHVNYRSGWYWKTPTATDKIFVNILTLVPDQLKAIINITLLHTEKQDFKEVFRVHVYTERKPMFLQKVEFWFGLKQEGSFEKVSFTITNRDTRYTNIQPGDDVDMRCSVDGCPAPILLTITDDKNQTVAHVPSNNSLVTEIRRVQCSVMGSYYCRAEAEDGRIIDSKVDLTVERCPVQLCRGEETSKIIFAAVKETVHFSLCLISAGSKLYSNRHNEPNKISIKFTRRESAGVYWTADITIYNIQDSDYGNKTINITNGHGSFDYHFQLKDPGSLYENTTRELSKEEDPPCSQYEEIRDTARSTYEEVGNVKLDMSARDVDLELLDISRKDVELELLDISRKDVELELSDIQDVAVEYQNIIPSL